MKTIYSIGMAISFASPLLSQSFQQTFSVGLVDFNHYSIETASNGDYLCAGTLFDQSGHQDIHVFRTNNSGTVLWEQVIDNSDDDRAFDLVEDPYGDIIVTGYTGDAVDSSALYVLKLNSSGGFIADRIITSFYTSAGTNIIYSAANDSYIVGGLNADIWTYGLNDNHALILELDLGLTVNWMHSYYYTDETHSSINDIVEVPSGYFITGSVDFPASPMTDQGVLALIINGSGVVVQNLSFHSTNSEHIGVSAVYVTGDDIIYLMSNNSVIHNPQITQIDNISGTPAISNQYYLELDPFYGSYLQSSINGKGSNAAGFQLVESLTDPDNLVAAGYFQAHDFGLGTPNTTPWILEFNKKDGMPQWAFIHQSIAPGFASHGGGTFSTFSGEHPYIFNQEILTQREDQNGYAFLAARTVDLNYGLDMVAINSSGLSSQSDCLYDYAYNPMPIGYADINILDFFSFVSDAVINTVPYNVTSDISYDCNVSAKKEYSNTSATSSAKVELSISPNPFTESITLQLEDELEDGNLIISDAKGVIVMERTNVSTSTSTIELDLNHLSNGIYTIQVLDRKTSFSKKIVKK